MNFFKKLLNFVVYVVTRGDYSHQVLSLLEISTVRPAVPRAARQPHGMIRTRSMGPRTKDLYPELHFEIDRIEAIQEMVNGA